MQDYYYELVVKVSSQHSLFSDFLTDTLPVGFEEVNDGFIVRSEDDLETIIWGLEQFNEALQKALSVDIELEAKPKNAEETASKGESSDDELVDNDDLDDLITEFSKK